MSMKYSFNWYSWFKKPEEIDTRQVDRQHVQTKHIVENYPFELKIHDKDLIRTLNRYNSRTTSKERRTSLKKSKTSLKVRRLTPKRKKHAHHTLQPKQDAYANKLHKTEFGHCSLSKNHKHYKQTKLTNCRDKHPSQDKHSNRYKHPGAGDMTADKNSRKERPSDYRKTIQTKEINNRICGKEKSFQNGEETQLRTRNIPFKKENRDTTPSRIKSSSKNENGKCRGMDSTKIENYSFKKESREITLKVIDLTTSFGDEVKNSADIVAGKKILRTEEEKLLNPKPIRTVTPEPNSDKPAMCLFSKVWPSDNSDEKISKQLSQIPGKNPKSMLHNKSKPLNEKWKQDLKRKTKTATSNNCIDSRKKGIAKNNRTLRFEDEHGKSKLKRSIHPKSNSYKDRKTEKINSCVPNSNNRLEHGKNNSECNEKSKRNSSSTSTADNMKICFETNGKNNLDSVNFISILKEIKSLKDQLKSLSDDDDSKDNVDTKTKTWESKRKLECIEEEIVENSNTEPTIPTSSDLQSMVSPQTVPCGEDSSLPLNNNRAESSISAVYAALNKSVLPAVSQDTSSCQSTPQLPPSMDSRELQAKTGHPCEAIEKGLDETKDFSICQSPAKCLSCNGLEKHDCNLFLNRRIFYFKNYIPASERKNKKEVLMKKRLLSRLRTYCSIPIKRKLDATSSSNLRKIRCSSSSKENLFNGREAPAYDFSPFLKQSIPCTSFLERSSSANPFLPYSDVSRCTSTTIITAEKVWSYMCSIDVDRRVKSESSLQYLKKPPASNKVFESNGSDAVPISKIDQKLMKPLDRKKRNERRSKIKNKQKSKIKTKKAKQKTVEEKHKVDNVLKIENLSSHSNSIWKTISIEFNDVSLKTENPLSEYRLQLMLSEITEYLKTKTVQPNSTIIKDFNIDSGIDNDVEDINIPQHTSNVDESEPLIKRDVCLAGFVIDGYSAPSEKSSQTSTNESPSTVDIDIRNPFVEIIRQGQEIQLLHENNEENKKEIEKIKETCKIKFPWLEKVIFEILTQYQKIPTDLPSISNIEQVCYSITNFTFRKSVSNSKNCHYRYQQIEKFKMFSEGNSIARELGKKEKTIEYHTVAESKNNNSIELAKNNKKSKLFHFTKNIKKVFRVFVGKKKH